MGKAKIATRSKQAGIEQVSEEERWVIIGGPSSFNPGYVIGTPPSPDGVGLTRERAEKRAQNMTADHLIVPYLALDPANHLKYSEELHKAYDERMAAVETEEEE